MSTDTYQVSDAELILARLREILRDPDLYDSYNSVTTRCLVRDIKEAMGLPQTGTDVPEPTGSPGRPAAIDAAHIARQIAFSRRVFGPGPRTAGVTDHIAKELDEIRSAPFDVDEWVDVIILGFDGAWRAGGEPQQIIDAIKSKQAKNEARDWPDWRTADPDKAIEHAR